MPNQARIEVNKIDLKRLNSLFNELRAIDGDADQVINVEAKNTVRRMERQAPVDTGRLKREIHFVHTGVGSVEFESEAIDPDTGVDYAPAQEFGTRFFKAQPYFFHNIRLFRRDLFNSLRKAINRKIRKYAK